MASSTWTVLYIVFRLHGQSFMLEAPLDTLDQCTDERATFVAEHFQAKHAGWVWNGDYTCAQYTYDTRPI